MRNAVIRKVQIVFCLVAAILIAVLSFFPVLKMQLSNESGTIGKLDTILIHAADITQNDPDLSDEEKDLLIEKLQSISDHIHSSDPEAGTYSLSVWEFIRSIPSTVMLIRYSLSPEIGSFVFPLVDSSYGDILLSLSHYRMQEYGTPHFVQNVPLVPSRINETAMSNTRLFLSMLSAEGFEVYSSREILLIPAIILFVYTLPALQCISFLVATLVIPIALWIRTIKLIVAIIKCKKRQGSVYTVVMENFRVSLLHLSFIVAVCIIMRAQLTLTAFIMLASVPTIWLVNLIASRLKKYTRKERKYLNLMQLYSLIVAGGGILFLLAAFRFNFVGLYEEAILHMYVTDDVDTMFILSLFSLFGIGVLLGSLIAIPRGVIGLLSNAACMSDCDEETGSDFSGKVLVCPILIVITNVIFVYLGKLSLAGDAMRWYSLSVVGAGICVVCGMITLILRRSLLAGYSPKETSLILRGQSSSEED